MFGIYLTNGALDVYKQDSAWEWTPVRFSEGLQDAYTTDIVIPKSRNNIYLLDAAGLLDRTHQPCGGKIAPCTLSTGRKNIDSYIEVVSITDDEINICIYERFIDNTSLKKWFVDDDSSIYVWNTNSRTGIPDVFKTYFNGVGMDTHYTQVHPCMQLNELIDRWSNASGIQIPHTDPKHYVVATGKYVCPQNHKQYIEGHWTDDSGEYAVLTGGQHITNDCAFSWSPSETKITFNRDCKVNIKCFYAWKKKSTVTNRFWFNVVKTTPGISDQALTCYMNSDLYANQVEWGTMNNVIFREGSTLYVRCPSENLGKYDVINFVLSLTITDYNITDNDYGNELQYVYRTPRLLVPSNDNQYTRSINGVWTQYSGYQYLYFDSGVLGYHYNRTGHPNDRYIHYVSSEWGSFAYFGFYCNLPDIELKNFLFGLCWMDKKKVVKHSVVENGWMENRADFIGADEWLEIEGVITETRISAEQLGQNNYILQAGEEQQNPVSTIENGWLEENVNLHESPFSYTPKLYGTMGCLLQYSKPEHDSETGEYKAQFDEVDGFAVLDGGGVATMLYRPELSTMGFEKMTQSVAVTIETTTNIPDLVDYVYLGGHKYMVVDVNTDLSTNFSTINAILVPNEESNIATGNTQNADWQDQPDPPDEPSYPDDDHEQDDDDHEQDDDPWDDRRE